MPDYINQVGASGYGNLADDKATITGSIDLGMLPAPASAQALQLAGAPAPGLPGAKRFPWGVILLVGLAVWLLSDSDRR